MREQHRDQIHSPIRAANHDGAPENERTINAYLPTATGQPASRRHRNKGTGDLPGETGEATTRGEENGLLADAKNSGEEMGNGSVPPPYPDVAGARPGRRLRLAATATLIGAALSLGGVTANEAHAQQEIPPERIPAGEGIPDRTAQDAGDGQYASGPGNTPQVGTREVPPSQIPPGEGVPPNGDGAPREIPPGQIPTGEGIPDAQYGASPGGVPPGQIPPGEGVPDRPLSGGGDGQYGSGGTEVPPEQIPPGEGVPPDGDGAPREVPPKQVPPGEGIPGGTSGSGAGEQYGPGPGVAEAPDPTSAPPRMLAPDAAPSAGGQQPRMEYGKPAPQPADVPTLTTAEPDTASTPEPAISELPKTGGPGIETSWALALGSALIGAGGAVWRLRRRPPRVG